MKNWIEGEGPVPCKLMIIGEGPGPTEIKRGKPFVGASGRELNNYLRQIGMDRDEFFVTNVIKRAVEKKEVIELDLALLAEEIAKVNPDVILTLGAIATHQFIDGWDMETLNAIPHERNGRIIIPCFHPAAAMRDTQLMAWIQEAFQALKGVLKGETPFWAESEKTKIIPLENCAGTWALDTETLKNMTPWMITATAREGYGSYVMCDDFAELDHLREIIKDKTVLLHNALFDLPILWRCNIYPSHWLDTMVIAFLLQTLPLGLKQLVYRLCGMVLKSYEETTEGKDWDEMDIKDTVAYACSDADATLRVHNAMLPRWYDGMDEVLQRDMDIMPMLIAMMERGITMDVPFLEEFTGELAVRNFGLLEEIRNFAGENFNPASAKQLSSLLYSKLGLGNHVKLKRTKWGKSTSRASLKKIEDDHYIIGMIEEWKETDTLIDKYLTKLPKKVKSDGKIHTNLSLIRVKHSGRLASSNPNLMAQPTRTEDGKRIRNSFLASPGYKLVSFDYNQIEMRMMAHLSQDPAMLKVYNAGGDIHTDTAMAIFRIDDPKDVDPMKHRYPAKVAGFGIINQISAPRLSAELKKGKANWTEEEAQDLLNAWFEVHEGVGFFLGRSAKEVLKYKKVTDIWGRMEFIPEVTSVFDYTREAGLRKASNQAIQSGAQGIIKEAMRLMWPCIAELRDSGAVYPLLQIHDALLFEIRKGSFWIVPHIKSIMEAAVVLSIPMPVEVEIGDRWGEMKKWKI